MIRNRGAAIIVQEGKIALIKRIREETYYVFLAEGLRKVKRLKRQRKEVYEELGVHIQVEHLIAKVKYKGNEYYYAAYITGGVFGSGTAEEFQLEGREIIFRYGYR